MDYNAGTIDLHIHSTASDGSLHPEQIIEYALEKGLSAIAITDHDTLAGVRRALKSGIPDTIEFVTGSEISAGFPAGSGSGGSLHILGYGIAPDYPDLDREMEKQHAARSGRNPRIIEKLNAMGIPASLEAISSATGKNETEIARPHIAGYLVKSGYAETIDDAFDRILGKGKPAYVDKYRVPADRAIGLILSAGGIAVLAHPRLLLDSETGRVPDEKLESLVDVLVSMGLEGIEVYYPGQTADQTAYFRQIAETRGLLTTGGTDFHGDINPDIEIGIGTGELAVPPSVFSRLKHALANR